MREVIDWDTYYLGLAAASAVRSKDPNTQVGAVLVNYDNRIIALGFNGFPEGIHESEERWGDDAKDGYVIHAEVNAIANAARAGIPTLGANLYLTLVPCLACARTVAAAGIARVVWPREAYIARIEAKPHREEIYASAMELLSACNIHWEMV